MFALSALAVDSEMVGRDSDAELIGGEGDWSRACCWAAAAASRAEVAECGPLSDCLDLGDVEKNWTILFAREDVRGMLPFSSVMGRGEEVDEGETAAKGFCGRRGIARCNDGQMRGRGRGECQSVKIGTRGSYAVLGGEVMAGKRRYEWSAGAVQGGALRCAAWRVDQGQAKNLSSCIRAQDLIRPKA